MSTRSVKFGAFELDSTSGELRKHGLKIRLQDQPLQILQRLVETPGEVVTRDELQKLIWPADTFVDFDHGLYSAVRRLRDALGDTAETPRYVETLPRRGYRFIASVNNASRDEVNANIEAPASVVSEQPTMYRRLLVTILVAAGTVVALLSALAFRDGTVLERLVGKAKVAPIRSIAVLPLANLSDDPAQEYFSDGMTDALITELSHVQGLRVISRTSTMHYKGTRMTLPEIARELQVDAIVEGTVVHDGDEVRVSAQLIRAATDAHLWAANYARVQRGVLGLQTDIAQQIAHQIGIEVSPVERVRSAKASTANPQAYEAYLKGTHLLNKMSPDAVRTSLHYYRTAIANDDKYAAAYARIATSYLILSILGEMPAEEAYARAREAAEKAVQLDENLSEAHRALGDIARWYDWDWSKAGREYRRAIELNPNDALAHLAYFDLLLGTGRPQEAAEELQKARELDPLSLSTRISVVFDSYFAKEYGRALLEARDALELYPESPVLHILLSNVYTQTQRLDLAAEEAIQAEKYGGASQERMTALRRDYRTSGISGLRRKRIELNSRNAGEHLNAYDIAGDYAALGDKDQTLYWLEKAYSARDPRLQLIEIDPGFDVVRSDLRFKDLIRRMNLPIR